jgi:hypothetical protein
MEDQAVIKVGDVVKYNEVALNEYEWLIDVKYHIVKHISSNGSTVYFEDGGKSHAGWLTVVASC